MKYPKLADREDCKFPEREICNYDDNGKFPRCPYMKYNRSKSIFDSTRWECTCKKSIKDKQLIVSKHGDTDKKVKLL